MSETRPKSSPPRWRRPATIGAAALLGILALTALGAYGLLRSDTGRRLIAEAIEDAVSTPGELELAIERIEGRLPQEIEVTGLRLRDARGEWLNAQAIRLEWSPLALLGGKLDIAALSAESVILERLPDAGGAGAPDEGGIPGLPFEIAVGEVSVGDFVLGETILGRRGRFRVEGRAAAEAAEGLITSLSIARSDGSEGRIELDAVYRPQDDRLRLDAAIEEPAGGLIAGLSGIPGLPATSARLAGDGTLSDWGGRLSLALDGVLALESQIKLARGAAFAFEVTGTARLPDPASLLPPEVPAALAAGDMSLAIAGQLERGNDLSIARASLENAAARVTLSGAVALDTLALDATAELDLVDQSVVAAMLPGLRVQDLRLNAHATGPALQPKIEARVRATALAMPELRAAALEAEIAFAPDRPLDRGAPEGALQARGSITGLTLIGLDDLAPLLGPDAAWRLTGRLSNGAARFDAEDLSVETGQTRLSASGLLDLDEDRIEATAEMALPDLAGLSPLLGLDLSGEAELQAWIESHDLGQSATAAVTGDLRRVALQDPALHALLGGTSSLAANVTLAPNGGVSAQDIALDTGAVKVAANLNVPPGFARLEAEYAISLPKLSVLAAPLGLDLAGGARMTGRADGALENPNLQGRLTLSKLRLEGQAVSNAEVQFVAKDLTLEPHGTLDLAAATAYGDVVAATGFRLAGPELRLSDLKAESRGAKLSGDLAVPRDGGAVSGRFLAEAPDLAPWLALAGRTGGGAAAAEIELKAEGESQSANLAAQLANPALGFGPGQSLRAASARIEANLTDLLGTPKGRAKMRTAALTLDEITFDSLELDAEGDLHDFAWRLSGTGAWRGPLILDAEGRLAREGQDVAVEVAALKGEALERKLALGAPVSFAQKADSLMLSPLKLAFGEAAITARASLDPDQVSAALKIEALPLASLDPVLPGTGIGGIIFTDLKIDGPRAAPSGGGKIEIRELDTNALLEGPELALILNADWREGRLNLAGNVSGLPGRDAEIAAAVPLAIDPVSLTPSVAQEAPISGKLAWTGAMEAIWPLVPQDGHQLSGAADLALNLSGTAAQPKFAGAVSLTGGAYENLETGTILKDLDTRIEFDDREARVASLSASDGLEGSLSGTGTASLDAQAGFPFDAEARMTDFLAVRRDEVSAITDGRVRLKGTLKDILISGEFETRLVEIRIDETLPSGVVTLDVIETDGTEKEGVFQQAALEAEPEGQLELDIAIAMRRRVFVRGRGLDSEWSGHLKLDGPAGDPRIVGQVNLVRGQLSLLTKIFRLTGGRILFPPGTGAVPQLDVTAAHDAGEITAVVKIRGPVTDPEFELTSTPELPRDEIVALILFGKEQGQLSPFQAAQLASALAELSGKGGGAGVLDFARNLMGVDVLRVEDAKVGGSAGPSVEAGSYAAEGVYVGVKKGVTDQSSAVAVEIEVTPNISVNSATRSTGESDIGVEFKWDY